MSVIPWFSSSNSIDKVVYRLPLTIWIHNCHWNSMFIKVVFFFKSKFILPQTLEQHLTTNTLQWRATSDYLWISIAVREGIQKKSVFFGYLSQMWVGGVDSQTRSKPLKTPPKPPRKSPFRPKFHLLFSQISQKPWGGWVNRFGKDIPKKTFFFGSFP